MDSMITIDVRKIIGHLLVFGCDLLFACVIYELGARYGYRLARIDVLVESLKRSEIPHHDTE